MDHPLSFITLKEVSNMRKNRKLTETKTFHDADKFSQKTTFPVIVTSENDDGTFSGYFDLNKMSAVKKILAIAN